MTKTVITAAPNDDVVAVAERLLANRISAVPVCNAEGEPIGIVSEGDLLRPFSQAHDLRRDWWLALLAEGIDLAPDFLDYVSQDRRKAADLMTTPVHTIGETAGLDEAAVLMTRHGIKRLPVTRAGKLVGIISRADLVRSFLDRAKPHAGASAHAELVTAAQ